MDSHTFRPSSETMRARNSILVFNENGDSHISEDWWSQNIEDYANAAIIVLKHENWQPDCPAIKIELAPNRLKPVCPT